MVCALRCLTCKVLFESIDALNDHCALTAHLLTPYRCLPCNRAFAASSGFQSHIKSAKHRSRTQISAQISQASHSATQPVPDVTLTTTLTTNNVEDQIQTVCRRCNLTFENHELLFEHYRTSSLDLDCHICVQVLLKKNKLKKHMKKYHPQVLVLPISKSEAQITTSESGPAPHVKPPPVFSTEASTQLQVEPELLEDDDFVLVEKSSLLLRTPETPTPVTSIPQNENTNAVLPTKCPGCHTHFHSFSTFVIHIDSGECSSASVSQQINNEINAFAVQLFRNLSVISG